VGRRVGEMSTVAGTVVTAAEGYPAVCREEVKEPLVTAADRVWVREAAVTLGGGWVGWGGLGLGIWLELWLELWLGIEGGGGLMVGWGSLRCQDVSRRVWTVESDGGRGGGDG
jgi:hypothetical protein